MTRGAEAGQAAETSGEAPAGGEPDRRLRSWLRLGLVLLVAAALSLPVRAAVVTALVVPDGAMAPVLQAGDRVLVLRWDAVTGHLPERGALVAVDVSGLGPRPAPPRTALAGLGRRVAGWLGTPSGERDLVRRVLARPGDRVAARSGDGVLLVEGIPTPVAVPAAVFDVGAVEQRVPRGELWVAPDRFAVGDDPALAGTGRVPVSRLLGPVTGPWWPLGADRAAVDTRGAASPDPASLASSARESSPSGNFAPSLVRLSPRNDPRTEREASS